MDALPLRCDLPRGNIVFIDDHEGLQRARDVLSCTTLAGIDTETKPQRVKGKRNKTALIQIACRSEQLDETVLLFDLIRLNPRLVGEVLRPFFLSQDIIKIGQGLQGDLKELYDSFELPHFLKIYGVLEINSMARALTNTKDHHSLQKLASFYLHAHLGKGMQCSNWARRPLLPAQLEYASLDALVLLRLHDAILGELNDAQFALTNQTSSPTHPSTISSRELCAENDAESSEDDGFDLSSWGCSAGDRPASPSSVSMTFNVTPLLRSYADVTRNERWLCKCGRVFKSETGMLSHQRQKELEGGTVVCGTVSSGMQAWECKNVEIDSAPVRHNVKEFESQTVSAALSTVAVTGTSGRKRRHILFGSDEEREYGAKKLKAVGGKNGGRLGIVSNRGGSRRSNKKKKNHSR